MSVHGHDPLPDDMTAVQKLLWALGEVVEGNGEIIKVPNTYGTVWDVSVIFGADTGRKGEYLDLLYNLADLVGDACEETGYVKEKETTIEQRNADAHGRDKLKGWGEGMEVTTYCYDGSGRITQIPYERPEDIRMIGYSVWSGDEVVDIAFKDGDRTYIDPRNRETSIFDGSCILTEPEQIKRWLAFKPTEAVGSSYERLEMAKEMTRS